MRHDPEEPPAGRVLVRAALRDLADFEPGDQELTNVVARLERELSGHAVGPPLPCSRVAVGYGGRPLGAALLTDLPA